ncbi:MAG TPA: serine/threonine-protein kinase [Fibrobacteria bacterium]|nr:serine/threonine-protein kinase [Fibrobacteria bacterium]
MTALPSGYSLAVRVGAGAFGEVFRAREDAARRWVALKRLSRYDLCKAEASALAAGLPCLPALYSVFSAKGAEWICMEYVHGLPLGALLASGVEPAEAAGLACNLVRALAALHDSGSAHGDLKPENILVQPDGGIRLLDLGLSAAGSDRALGGSAGYTAPEAGSPGIDPRKSDLWSLGVVLHEILTGARPAPAEKANGWARLRAAAPGWIPAVDQLLEEDPARRPSSIAVLLPGLPAALWSEVASDRLSAAADRRLAALLGRQAEDLVRRGRSREALPLLQEALDLDPDQNLSLGLLPRLRLDEGRSRRRVWVAVAVAVVAAIAVAGVLALREAPEEAYVPLKTAPELERLPPPRGGSGNPAMPLRERGIGP